MGISYTALAILSVTMFISLLLAVALTSIHSVEQASYTPLLNVHVEAFVDPEAGVSTIVLSVKHEYGRPVYLLYLDLKDLGKLDPRDFEKTVCSELIKHGDFCVFKYTLRELLDTQRTYKGVVVFSEGTYPVAFTPLYVYKPVRNAKPVYNVTFTGVSLNRLNTYSIIANTSYLTGEGAWLYQNGTGLVVVDNETYRYFGGVGFVYNNATGLEYNLTKGSWLIALLRLVNTTGKLPLKFGIGIFYDHQQPEQPQELIAFTGISVNTSTTAYLVVERYDRDKGLVEVVASTSINASLEKLFSELLVIAAYIEVDKNFNFFRVNATLYDINLTTLAFLSGSFTVKLPGTPGETWYLRPALVVNNTAMYYEDFVLAGRFTLPLITVMGVPADYILEVYMNGALVFRAVSCGDPVIPPFTWLPSGSVLLVKYPSAVGEALAYRYVTPVNIGPSTEILLNAVTVDTAAAPDGGAAVVAARLPVGNGFTNVTGFIATNITNRNAYPAKLRLTALNVTGNPTINITILNSAGRSVFNQFIRVEEGVLVSNTTEWSVGFVNPGETLYLYVVGYFTNPGQTSRIVLRLETILIDQENTGIVGLEERPAVLNIQNT